MKSPKIITLFCGFAIAAGSLVCHANETESASDNAEEIVKKALDASRTGDIGQAIQLAKENNPKGFWQLGVMYYNKADYDTAAALFKKGAELGSLESAQRLGLMKMSGKQIPKDYPGAIKLLKPLAGRGEPESCWALGCIYSDAAYPGKNDAEALRCFKMSTQNGNSYHHMLYAAVLMEKKDRTQNETDEMMHSFKVAADQQEPNAAFRLGVIFAEGIPFVSADQKMAYHYFLIAETAAPGRETEYNLGITLERMIEAKENLTKENSLPIFYWYNLAKKNGHPDASGRIGLLHFKLGDYETARSYLEPYSERGEAASVIALSALDMLNAELLETEDSDTGMPTVRRLFAEQYKRAMNGDANSALILANYFLFKRNHHYYGGYETGLAFLHHAARLNHEGALLMTGKIDNTPASEYWQKLSGEAFAKELQGKFEFISWRNDAAADYRNILSILNETGLNFMFETMQYSIEDGHTDSEFYSVAVRQNLEKQPEYYMIFWNGRQCEIIFLKNAVKFLGQWNDQCHYMVAYRTAEGKIVITGLASAGSSGEYYGNDGKYNTPVPAFKYSRGDFKESHPAAIESFIPALKKLLTENKRGEIAALVKYPLVLEADSLLERKINTAEEFLKEFDSIFTEDYIRRIMNTPDDELFTTWEGVGIGQSLLWICPGGDKEEKTVKIGRFENRLLRSIERIGRRSGF